MIVYFASFIGLIVLSALEMRGQLGRWKVPLFVATGAILVLVAGLKWTTGTDWQSYYEYFMSRSSFAHAFEDRFEPGFALWNFALAEIWKNYSFYMIATGTLAIGITFLAIGIKSESLFASLAVLYSINLMDLSLTRQAIAGALVLLAIVELLRKKRLEFLVLVILAGTFHASALVAVVAIFLDFEWPLAVLIPLLGIAFFLGFTDLPVAALSWAASWMPIDSVKARILAYVRGGSYFGLSLPPFRIVLGPVKHLLPLALFAFYRYGPNRDNREYRRLFNIYALGVIIYLTTFNDSKLIEFQRLFFYFDVAQALLTAAILARETGRRRLALGATLSIYYAIATYFALHSYWGFYVPYKWILGGRAG